METTRDPRRRPPSPGGRADEAAPERSSEALERARGHARRAAREALASLRALLDAAALAASGKPSEIREVLRPLARLLAGLGDRLERADWTVSAPIVEAIGDALDVEIARWQKLAQDDPEARAVLRAFLGLRELLWELGRKQAGSGSRGPGDGTGSGPARRAAARRRRRRRVQRVPVEG